MSIVEGGSSRSCVEYVDSGDGVVGVSEKCVCR